MKVCVLDMQPITPPVGGGRLRLLGLYHDLGVPTTYVGTYDWPGESARDEELTATLREVTVPLSAEHFAAVEELRARVGGKVIIDSTFHQFAHLSPAFVARAREEARAADVVCMSHPWVYPLVADGLDRSRQVLVYDAQNFEGVLRMSLLDDGGPGTEIACEVIRLELELCRAADLILACSHEDRLLFHELYGIPCCRIKLCPNGVFTEMLQPADEAERKRTKQELGILHPAAAIFLGSGYAFNVEAAQFIIEELAPGLPDVLFVIAGGVGDALPDRYRCPLLSNVRITGLLSEEEKHSYLIACDLALNPMFGGSGTNIKMFDYMASGLPTISSPIGARGIVDPGVPAFLVVEPKSFLSSIRLLMRSPSLRHELARNARRLVCELYSWERISQSLGTLFRSCCQNRGKPWLSAILLNSRRHERLERVLGGLHAGLEDGVEIIVVDQSRDVWSGRASWEGPGRVYFHIGPTGRATAANLASFLAVGQVLAFLGDVAAPDPLWLGKLRACFARNEVAAAVARGSTGIADSREFAIRQEVLNRTGGFLIGPDHECVRIAADWVAVPGGPASQELTLYGLRSASGSGEVTVADWVACSAREFVQRAALSLLGDSASPAKMDEMTARLERRMVGKMDILAELLSAAQQAGACTNLVPLMPDVFYDEDLFLFSLDELLRPDGKEFIENLYRKLLRREPDELAFTVPIAELIGPSPMKIQLIRNTLASEEAGRVGVKVIGLDVFLPADAPPGTVMHAGLRRTQKLPAATAGG
jgi:glycosyltransferase involved in cell wall biosynthesis